MGPIIPAKFKAIKAEVVAPLDCIIKVKSQPKPNAFISFILSPVILRRCSPISLKEYLINTKEKRNK